MIKVMEGVRVLEVAQFTFVPAAGAILADWGADVIKVEHPVRGDTQRGFLYMGGIELQADRHPLMEHPNRGKRSVGIDVSTPGGQEVLHSRPDARISSGARLKNGGWTGAFRADAVDVERTSAYIH